MGSVYEAIAAYYRTKAVRARLDEYCRSALGVGGYGGQRRLMGDTGGPVHGWEASIETLLAEGADVCRSLADRDGVLVHLDMDYVNRAFLTEPLERPEPCFEALEPAYQAARHVLAGFGVAPLALITGRGYHLTVRVRRGSPLWAGLVRVGHLGAPLLAKYEFAEKRLPGAVEMGRAHEGAGRLLELAAHEIIRTCAAARHREVELSDHPRDDGRPSICLDLSQYADPLFERTIRAAFSTHQKAHLRGLHGPSVATVLPRGRGNLAPLLAARLDLVRAAAHAERSAAEIPDAPADAIRWLDAYERSSLARFHRAFDADQHEEPSRWSETYDRLDLSSLPACVAESLAAPKPALLEPARLRLVALALGGLGWRPRAIAGLIRSKYERDFGWGGLWYRYDAAARADFYVRLFCAAAALGLDGASRFTCDSERRRGICARRSCGHDLGALVAGDRR